MLEEVRPENHPYEMVCTPTETGAWEKQIRCVHCQFPVHNPEIRGHYNNCIYSK
jgi:hypothetical protein